MEIILAENIGFCFGVERAYNMSLDALKQGKLCQMLGHLVHNEKVVDELKSKGLIFVSSVDEVKEGIVIIRAHGVGDDTIEDLKKKNVEIIEATCPLVKKAQEFARSLDAEGCTVVIIGEEGHAEVKAINGAMGKRGIVIKERGDIFKIPKSRPIGVVVQTTQDLNKTEGIITALKSEFDQIKVCDTLCYAVKKRQEELKKIIEKSDLVLVIGSKTSANTQTLVNIAQKSRKPAYGVEDEKCLRKEWFSDTSKVGIISGTSVPRWLIDRIINELESYEE